MKKILFMIKNMNIGGTEKSLLNILCEIPQKEYEVTILMLENKGEFLNDIPRGIKVKTLKDYGDIINQINSSPKEIVAELIKNKHFINALNIGTIHIISKLLGDRTIFFKYLTRNLKNISEKYDIAIAYAGPLEFITYYVLNRIKAKKKYQWIHFDVRKIYFNKRFSNNQFKKFNNIVVVSEEGKQSLVSKCPKLEDKIKVRLNTIPKKSILKGASLEKGFNDVFDGTRILTVGRLSYEKGQDIAIKICKQLVDSGKNIRWYCIGQGYSYSKYKKLVEELDIKENFKLLGAKKNPYPYMKECDIYVQPSRHEGFCITLGEAKIFNKPIVSTDFAGAKEQLKNMKNSYIVDSEEEIYNTIKSLLK